jgi:hypothetical protein
LIFEQIADAGREQEHARLIISERMF